MESGNLDKYICTKPFQSTEFYTDGSVYCCCPSWISLPLGNSHQESIDDIWNSTNAKLIRESIRNGCYTYCDHKKCPYIQSKTLSKKSENVLDTFTSTIDDISFVMLNNDLTCNLSCPSCRNELIVWNNQTEEVIKSQQLIEKIESSLLSDNNKNLTINITGSGDPFSSMVFKQFLLSFDGKKFPNVKFEIQTNGILLNPEMWEKLKNIHQNISKLLVSVDAQSEATYLKVRRGGDFNILLNNLVFLVKQRKMKKFHLLQLRFVVQKENYKEILSFAKKFLKLGIDSIEYSLVEDWNSWNKSDYLQQKIWDKSHPDFKNFAAMIMSPSLNHPRIHLGNMTGLRNEAIKEYLDNSSVLTKTKFYSKCFLLSIRSLLLKCSFYLSKKIMNDQK
jgi:MoaA/NifB/PqqE/SkfB family radical SAM enzyme